MRGKILVSVGAAIALAAATGASAPAASAACATTATANIDTQTSPTYSFLSNDVTISTCTAVTWTLHGIHTATSDATSGEAFNLNGASGTHLFLRQGTYNYHCNFHQALGMTGVIRVTSGADADSAPTATLSGPMGATVGQPATFDGTGSNDPDSGDTLVYRWDFNNDGTFEQTTATPTALTTFTTAGQHTVGLEVTDDHGLSSTPQTVSVDVAPAPPSSGGGGGGGTGGTGGSGGGGGTGAAATFAGIKLSSTKASVGSNRTATLRVKCPSGTTGSCTGKLTLKDGSKRVAAKSFKVASGKTASVKLKLSSAEARKLIKRRTLKLSLAISVHDGAGTAAPAKKVKLTLKRKS